MAETKSKNKIVAQEKNFQSGTIGSGGKGIKDAYDLFLVETPSKNYFLIAHMRIQFDFQDTGSNKWTSVNKRFFVSQFKIAVKKKWGDQRVIKNLSSGKRIYLVFHFSTTIDKTITSKHWLINVKKIEPGGFSQSWVHPTKKTAQFDSEDLKLTFKGHGQKQRGIVHEFGHMLGLPDEYKVGTTHAEDYQSIMNRGESVLIRHDSVFMLWLEKTLKANKIK